MLSRKDTVLYILLIFIFLTGFDGSATGDGTINAGGEGGAVGDAQGRFADRSFQL